MVLFILVYLGLRFFVGAENGSRHSQIRLNLSGKRMCAAKHAPRSPFHLLVRRHGLAEIVERSAGVLVERPRVNAPGRASSWARVPSSTTAAVQRLPPQLLRDAGLAGRPNAPIGARAAPAPTHETVDTPQGTLPSVRLLLQFDFVMTQRLVAMHVRWLDSCALSHNRALWLYALLARLHKPLHRDTCAVLRQLVKRLLALRDSCEEPAALNALLVLAGRYFDQASADEIGSF